MSLEGQNETIKEQEKVQSATCSFEMAKDKKLGKLQERKARNALDSDETLPYIEPDTVIDADNLSEDTHINEQDINENQLLDEEEDDDFGSFDHDPNGFSQTDDDFDRLDQDQLAEHKIPVFDTLQEALDIWQKLLDQVYGHHTLNSFTSNAPKNIRVYVLEEAPESLHSRLTWDSVTRYMDNDTGIPKVRWYQSEIEKLHLKALACKRSVVPILHTGPTMLHIGSQTMSPESTNNPPIQSAPTADAPRREDIAINTATIESNHSTPTSEKRSSVFSLSRFLPHLSKTNLPKSPTSPTPSTPSTSPRSFFHHHQDASIPTAVINHMNIQSTDASQQQQLSNNNVGIGKLRRSNTVAFSSIRAKASSNSILNILDVEDENPKPRPTSFHATSNQIKPATVVSMDLFDLTDNDEVLKSPTSLQFNASSFKPLVPTVNPISLESAATINRRNTLPEETDRPDVCIEPTITKHLGTAVDNDDDDDFGDFTDEQDNGFDELIKTTSNDNDDDPFGLLSYHTQSLSHQSSSNTTLTPTQTILPITDDLSAPKAIGSPFDLFSPTEKTFTVQKDMDLLDFDMNDSTNEMTGKNKGSENKVEDDDEWGDWTF